MKKYRLIVIGAGSAGLSAIDVASQLGLKGIALVEREPRLGGECLHSGCVPSKALIHAAQAYSDDPSKAWAHIKKSIETIEKRSDNIDHVQSLGVDVYTGQAHFTNAHTLQIGDQQLRADLFLVATGSDPVAPEIAGLDTVSYLTNETIFKLEALPKTLAIIGGGPIGCELAGALAQLGVAVTLLQSADRLLPREAPDVSHAVADALKADGVTVVLNARTHNVAQQKGMINIDYDNGTSSHIAVDALLVAAGRAPRIDSIGLDVAGVKTTEMGVVTDKYLRTTRKHIYAAGDVTTSPKFTHLAAQQAGLAIRNMLSGPFKKSVKTLSLTPAITFTSPNIARYGIDSASAASHKDLSVLRIDYADIDRAVTDEQSGYLEVVVTKRDGMIKGVTVVGPEASELLSPLIVAARHDVPFDRLATAMFPYPTLASGINILAGRYATSNAASGTILKLIKTRWRA